MNRGVVDGVVEERADDVVAGLVDGHLGGVLDQVRHTAMHLLSELGQPPHVLRLRAGEVSVELEWEVAPVPAAPPAAATGQSPAAVRPSDDPATPPRDAAPAHYIDAPTVGVFYRAPEPGAPPFVNPGDLVSAGQQVGIVEAMKLMIPVHADRPGRVTAVLKENGESVEYGEHLFAIAPDEG
ncbi:MAG TPA: biotin/lipoyl-containing protein [Micromonosporaceae bacterium]